MQDVSNKTKEIDNVFAPSSFSVNYPSERKEEDLMNEKKKQGEEKIYKEVVLGLESDLKNLGMDLTYSSKIIIREIAMNTVLINRIKLYFVCRGLLRDKRMIKPIYTVNKQDSACPSKTTKSIAYEEQFLYEEEINPVFDKLLPKIQKQINEGLKALALLPVQQIERQKITIIKKLRQRCNALDKEYIIETKTEKNVGV